MKAAFFLIEKEYFPKLWSTDTFFLIIQVSVLYLSIYLSDDFHSPCLLVYLLCSCSGHFTNPKCCIWHPGTHNQLFFCCIYKQLRQILLFYKFVLIWRVSVPQKWPVESYFRGKLLTFLLHERSWICTYAWVKYVCTFTTSSIYAPKWLDWLDFIHKGHIWHIIAHQAHYTCWNAFKKGQYN